ncbi:hypothetical protein HQ447_15305, partial [bacterium]|nr:hypothetical protein [bacterium]
MSAENEHHRVLAEAIARVRARLENQDLPSPGESHAALDILSAGLH